VSQTKYCSLYLLPKKIWADYAAAQVRGDKTLDLRIRYAIMGDCFVLTVAYRWVGGLKKQKMLT